VAPPADAASLLGCSHTSAVAATEACHFWDPLAERRLRGRSGVRRSSRTLCCCAAGGATPSTLSVPETFFACMKAGFGTRH